MHCNGTNGGMLKKGGKFNEINPMASAIPNVYELGCAMVCSEIGLCGVTLKRLVHGMVSTLKWSHLAKFGYAAVRPQ